MENLSAVLCKRLYIPQTCSILASKTSTAHRSKQIIPIVLLSVLLSGLWGGKNVEAESTKYTPKTTMELFQSKHFLVLEWPSQSPNLDDTNNLTFYQKKLPKYTFYTICAGLTEKDLHYKASSKDVRVIIFKMVIF